MDDIVKVALYIIPTPIGNLGDITFRAIEILKSVDVILAEDTRKSTVLMKRYSVSSTLKSFHSHNEHKITEGLVSEMKGGKVFALVSDAGTPGISDPGFLLTRACLMNGLTVNTLPGPTAFVPALVNSGLPCDRFVFEGFLPHKKGRTKRLLALSEEDRTMIFYESPHRLLRMLSQLIEIFDEERRASVSRELTKIHEETVNGTLKEIHDNFVGRKDIKGEIVIIVNGKK